MKINEYLQIADAANFLGISTQTLKVWEERKKITSYRNPVNGYRLYLKKDLQQLLDKISASKKMCI